ncbi:MAG TPA: fluoride efflux transporter CrcB [Solibacterales bacterium]|nr:fluoride efflux transporter CrcB [Bryobacterales bacterium]
MYREGNSAGYRPSKYSTGGVACYDEPVPPFLWVALGSAAGGAARYFSYLFLAQRFDPAFPVTTLAVNVLGSFAIGFVMGRPGLPEPVRLFLAPGLCGGFTTFSTFSLDVLTLLREGEPGKAAAYALASVALCLGGVWAGWWVSGR